MVYDLGLLYEQTIKLWIVYNTNNNKANTLKPLCPIRWTGKSCIKNTLDQYSGINDALK